VTPRLASSVLVGGLLRKAEAEGGFATVLAKGDPTAGSVVVILVERGGDQSIMERILQADGRYRWQETGRPAKSEMSEDGEVSAFVARRRRSDPDLWVLELDIPSLERFAAEMNGGG